MRTTEISNMENSKVQEPQAVNLWLAVRRNWLITLIVTLGVFSFPAYIALTKKPSFQSNTSLLVANQKALPIAEDATGGKANQAQSELSTEIEILKSPALLSKAVKNLPMSQQGMEVSEIVSGLSIQQTPNTSLLVVSYVHHEPQVAHEVLKALVKTYIDYSRESQRSPVTNSIRFIEAQLPEARQKLEKTSAGLTKFRQTYNLDALDTAAATAQTNRESLQSQINGASVELAKTQQLSKQLMQQAPSVNLNVNTLVNDTVLSQDETYQNLLTQLRTLDAQYAVEQTRLQPLHPALEDLRERRDETRQLLQMQVQRVIGKRQSQAALNTTATGAIQQDVSTRLLEAQNNLAVLTAQMNSLRQAESQAVKKLQQILSLQQTYRELQREYALNSKTVDNFLSRLQEFKIREAQDTSSWKVLEPPQFPKMPVPANFLRDLLLGLVQGAIAGVTVAFLLEKLDRRIKGIQEIKDLTKLPILGSLPKVSQKALTPWIDPSNATQKDELLSDSARSIALSLQFQQILGMVQQRGKIFVITSTGSGEGKTTLTQNLGVMLTELGRKVLIVDANLSAPSLHKGFGISNQSGFATALTTSHPWQGFIQLVCPKQMATVSAFNGHSDSSLRISAQQDASKQLEFFNQTISGAPVPLFHPHLEDYSFNVESGTETISPLNILPSGLVAAQPVVWLASPKVPQMLEQWRDSYDCVLIDTPSMNALADVQCLIPYADGVILTVGLKRTTHQLLTQTLEVLQTIEAKIAGLVINFCS
jgi:polysaccharide biosynthesis transport protein